MKSKGGGDFKAAVLALAAKVHFVPQSGTLTAKGRLLSETAFSKLATIVLPPHSHRSCNCQLPDLLPGAGPQEIKDFRYTARVATSATELPQGVTLVLFED